jgi:RecA/RadA recombinase
MSPIEVDATLPAIERMRTGLWGLDLALSEGGELGIPLRGIYELYGKQGLGKSSLSYYLAGKRATKELNKVVLCDLEATADVPFIVSNLQAAKFDGTLYVIRSKDEKEEKKKKGKKEGKKPEGLRSHESMLKEAIDSLIDKDVCAVILDSIGGMAPLAELDADLGEGQLGRRGFIMAQGARRAVAWLRNVAEPKLFLAVNHVQTPIGGRGHITPGGETLKYLAEARIMMYRDEGFDDGTFVTEFVIERLKHGGADKDRKGYIVIIPGIGLSPELTAMWDCFGLGLAERGATVKMKGAGQSVGYMSKLIEAAKDPEGKKKFHPFFSALEEYEKGGNW